MSFAAVRFTKHEKRRMDQRGITEAEGRQVLANGEVIATYPEDIPHPSYLILGRSVARPLHVVATDVPAAEETIVITAYEPDPERWKADFRRRKS